MKRNLLLISSSKTYRTGFLEHAADAIENHLTDVSTVLFVPFALGDRDRYENVARGAFEKMGFGLISLHHSNDPIELVNSAEAIFIGGGNTFRLLKTMYDLQLMAPIRLCVEKGIPYMGSSAGTNIVCPTIRTTNDMPIVQPPSFDALNVIPFQINPHYIDPDPDSRHQGETRATRLTEFHEENSLPVLGIREGCWLNVQGKRGQIGGHNGAVLFQRNQQRQEMKTGEAVDFLLHS